MTHAICDNCWWLTHPDQIPYRIKEDYREEEVCLFCGLPTKSGIYIHK